MRMHTVAVKEKPSFGAFRRWRTGERGVSEIVSALFVLPVLAFLIFALIDTGVYMHYRSMVDITTQQTVRRIAQDGGFYWARTSAFPDGVTSAGSAESSSSLEAAGGWPAVGKAELEKLCGAPEERERCAQFSDGAIAEGQPPTMECEVENGETFEGGVSVAKEVNTNVTCTATFYYNPVSPLSTNLATSLGFSTLLTKPIVIKIDGRTTVGSNS